MPVIIICDECGRTFDPGLGFTLYSDNKYKTTKISVSVSISCPNCEKLLDVRVRNIGVLDV